MTASISLNLLRSYAGAIVAGLASAALFSYAIQEPSFWHGILTVFSGLPLILAGLGAGPTAGMVASLSAAVYIVAMQTVGLALFYCAIFALPVAGLCVLVLRHKEQEDGTKIWISEGAIVTAIAIYPCVGFLAAILATLNFPGGLLGLMTQLSAGVINGMKEQMGSNAPQYVDTFNILARVMPFIIGTGWILLIALSMYIVQFALEQMKWNLRPPFEISKIELPRWLLLAVLITAIIGAVAPTFYAYVAGNIGAILLAVPFLFAGIGVVHAWARRSVFELWILVGYYLLLGIPYKWMQYTMLATFAFTLLLGMSDVLFHFRRRFVAAKPIQQRRKA